MGLLRGFREGRANGGGLLGGLLGALEGASMSGAEMDQAALLRDAIAQKRGQQSQWATMFGGYDPNAAGGQGVTWQGPRQSYNPTTGRVESAAPANIPAPMAGLLGAMGAEQGMPAAAGLLNYQMERGDKRADTAAENAEWERRFGLQSQQAREMADLGHQRALEVARIRADNGGQDPAAVKEWQVFSKMTPAEQRAYLTMKRANPYLNAGDAFVQMDPLNPGAPLGSVGVGVAPQQEIKDGRVITLPGMQGGARGPMPPQPGPAGQQGPTVGQFLSNFTPGGAPAPIGGVPGGPMVTDLPLSREEREKQDDKSKAKGGEAVAFERQLRTGFDMLYSPEREAGTGFSSIFSVIPGSDARTFDANLTAFKAQAFLPMVKQLQGMGALSNAEGDKLTAAIGALDPGMSEAAFKSNLETILGDIAFAYEKAFGRKFVYKPGGVAGQMNDRASGRRGGVREQQASTDGFSIREIR